MVGKSSGVYRKTAPKAAEIPHFPIIANVTISADRSVPEAKRKIFNVRPFRHYYAWGRGVLP